jgi:flagellar biosynthesis protein FlhG
MPDQAESLRQLVRQLEARGGCQVRASARPLSKRRARVVAVSGGKGGVGKSSLSVNLGLALAASGRRVLLVDADLGLASIDVLLGVQAEYSLAEVALDELPAGSALVRVAEGLDLLPGASGVAEMTALKPIQLDHLLAELTRLESGYEVVLIDTAAGAGEDVRAFLRAADRVVIVTNPEPTAITDAYALSKLLAREGQRQLGLVVNMARSEREGQRVATRLAAVGRRHAGLEIVQLGAVPFDWEVAAAVRERRPVLIGRPRAAASGAIRRVAASAWRWFQPRRGERERGTARMGLAGMFRRAARV